MKKITPRENKALMQRSEVISKKIYTGNYNRKIDPELVHIQNRIYQNTLRTGIGKHVDTELYKSLSKNVRDFSLAKNYNLIDELKKIPTSLSESDFLIEAAKVYGLYNDTWANTENAYIDTSASTVDEMAEFRKLEDTHYMCYNATNDELTRDDHADLDGTTLPIDDPFWDQFMPGVWDYNCRCYATMVDMDEVSDKDLHESMSLADEKLKEPDKQPGLEKDQIGTGEIFTEKHNYFENAPSLEKLNEFLK